jgi:hypothetical protein
LFTTEMSGQQAPLAVLKRLSKAGLGLFDSQPRFSSTVEAWVKQQLERNDAGEYRDKAGIAALISNQKVVQLLAAAVTTLLRGMAATTAGAITQRRLDAFRDLGESLSLIMEACKEVWTQDRSKQERQKVMQQVVKSGAGRHLEICAAQLLRTAFSWYAGELLPSTLS